MLDSAAVRALVTPLAEAAVAPSPVRDVRVTLISDFEGEAALEVIVVADEVDPNRVVERQDAAVKVLHALQAEGEDRHAYIRFAEPSWLEVEVEGE